MKTAADMKRSTTQQTVRAGAMRGLVLMLRVLMCAGLLASSGCQRPVSSTPKEAATRYLQALQARDAKRAWALISASTRVAMTERAKLVSEASKGAIKNDPAAQLFQGVLERGATVSDVRQTGDAAMVELTGPQGTQQLKLVMEEGQWMVDLSEALVDARGGS